MAVATQNQTTLLATSITQSVITTVNTDKVTARCYSPFGFLSTDDSIDASVAFNGAYHEPATHIYLLGNGYRAFNPVLMRFHSPDSFSPFGEGGLNAYVYVENDPANRIDPSGHLDLNPAKLWRRAFKGSKHGYALYGLPNDAMPVEASIYNIKEVGLFGQQGFWFSDYYKGDKTLFINAHGGKGHIALAPGRHIDATRFVELLKSEKILQGNYKRINLLSCHLAEGGTNSFAQEVHNLTGLKIKAYETDIYYHLWPGKLSNIVYNLENIQPIGKILINERMMIVKYKKKNIRHSTKVEPRSRLEIYSPRHFR